MSGLARSVFQRVSFQGHYKFITLHQNISTLILLTNITITAVDLPQVLTPYAISKSSADLPGKSDPVTTLLTCIREVRGTIKVKKKR
jgi:hypothetical protein